MEPYEWAYWMEGKPAEKDIVSPTGEVIAKAGEIRDGGCSTSAWGRGGVEHGHGRGQVHGRKWNEFVAA